MPRRTLTRGCKVLWDLESLEAQAINICALSALSMNGASTKDGFYDKDSVL